MDLTLATCFALDRRIGKNLQKMHPHFESSGNDDPPFTFADLNVAKSSDMSVGMGQSFYLKKIECIQSDYSFVTFLPMSRRVSWLANTRAGTLLEIPQVSQVTESPLKGDVAAHVKRLYDFIHTCTQ